MTSQQTTLGEGATTAEELAESQREISIAEFFEKNKHMLGFDSGARGLVTAVKEAVDNALDATEEAGIRPDIYVEIREVGDYYRLVVEDNGPGITKEQLPKVFGKLLYGSRFHSREQTRGQQGIGISAAVLYSQLTSGKPAKITSRTQGSAEAEYFELIIDTDSNEPEIQTESTTSWDRSHGTRIELEMEANMRARAQLHDYVKHTAVVNPHARIELREPGLDEPLKFERATDQLPAETKEIRPHPHGVELGTLIKMLGATDSYSVSGFMQEEFTRVGKKTADSVIDAFRDRHFGRELGWPARNGSPGADVTADIEATLREAVSNKGADATDTFAERIANSLTERERTNYSAVVDIVATVADEVGTETGKTFGSTVRENAVEAAWTELTRVGGDTEENGDGLDRLTPTLYELVDDATSTRKDDAAVHGLAERLAERLVAAGDDGPDRMRFTHSALKVIVDEAADTTEEYDEETFGDTARENVVEALWSRMVTVPDDPPNVTVVAEDRDTASELLEAMRATDILAPPTDCLAPITEELVEAGLRKEYDADFYAASTRDAEVHGGDPFVVEAGIAYGGEIGAEGNVELLRFANRVPLVYQRGACATTDVVKRIGWRNYGLDQPGGSGMPSGPAVISIHVASTNVPFTSESKDALASVPAIEDEIELAIREAARELKSYLNKRRSMAKRREKQDVLGRILPQMAEKVSEVTGREYPDIEGAMARIMNNIGVDRERDDDSVTLTVENHSSRGESLEITEIVSAEPAALPDGVDAIEVDDEWFIKWNPEVGSGETVELTYSLPSDADADANVDGVDAEKLTVNA
ncbi:DNA topoisomerase VI subunit B [Halolamina litorea]|uniref:Type 2 DNA topoisomerase 6 subunit B n=1 Tax=Halolamina litorea TaxID=1515593 RepID=A0ABD6BQ22_9EURY|nr:DNA topoisomerase VI subunit B [Halolamina litorea]